MFEPMFEEQYGDPIYDKDDGTLTHEETGKKTRDFLIKVIDDDTIVLHWIN